MIIKKSFNISDHKKILFFILFVLSLLFNQHYGNRGVFPIDSFLIFDAGYNIISGNHPFKDYWTITGPFLDYTQSLFFSLFGVNWFSYVFHASVLNMVFTVFTFYFFLKIGLKTIYAFFYSLGVLILAYPNIGTPFIDHHAVIFCVLSLYCFSLGMLLKKNYFWFLIPILLTFSFFSKQIPSSYIVILFTFIFIFYFFYTKNLKKENFIYLIYGLIFSILLVTSIFLINKIPVKDFLIQYIFYPISLGEERIAKLNFDFKNLISQFKFIYLLILPLLVSLLFAILIKKKNKNQKNEIIIAVMFSFSVMIFIYCQLITKNQVLIFFLIPISAGLSHFYILKYYNKKYIIYFILAIFVFSTIKNHIRFNQNKKFVELANADFSLAEDAKKIDSKFKELKWITPYYIDKPIKEINLLIDTKNYLTSVKSKKVIIGDYLFLSSFVKNEVASPNKWYDDMSVPNKNNIFHNEYKKYFLSKIKKNKVKYIFIIKKNEEVYLKQFIEDKECIKSRKINEILTEFKLDKCNL